MRFGWVYGHVDDIYELLRCDQIVHLSEFYVSLMSSSSHPLWIYALAI